jgi:cysteine synthase
MDKAWPFAARQHGVKVTIFVPHGNAREKNAAMAAFGATVIEYGHDFEAARLEAVRRAAAMGPQVRLHCAVWRQYRPCRRRRADPGRINRPQRAKVFWFFFSKKNCLRLWCRRRRIKKSALRFYLDVAAGGVFQGF